MKNFKIKKIISTVMVASLLMSVWVTAIHSEEISNGFGILLVRNTSQADSYSSQSNGAGARLELAGTDQSSVDTINTNGAIAFIGLLDPVVNVGPPGNDAAIRDFILGQNTLIGGEFVTADQNQDSERDVSDLINVVNP